MDKERFLDVNGFSTEYDIPLRKRLNKYGRPRQRDTTRSSISLAERLAEQSYEWKAREVHKQRVQAVIAAAVFVLIIAAAISLAYF